MNNQEYFEQLQSDIRPTQLIVDASLLTARMAYATELSPVFLKGDETDMNGVSGFIEEIETIRELIPSITQVHVAWEGGGRRMRRAIHPEYKAHRDKPSKGNEYMTSRVFPAKELLRKRVLPLTAYHQYESVDWEGDDAMGTLARVYADRGVRSLILTNDHDLLQLLDSELISILQCKRSKWVAMTEERFVEEYEIAPPLLIDVKAMAGDASDNYQGVPRVGDKTAIKFIKEHGSLEGVIESAKSTGLVLGKEKWAQAVLDSIEACWVGQALATIRTDTELRRISKPPKSFERFDEMMTHLKLYHLKGIYDGR